MIAKNRIDEKAWGATADVLVMASMGEIVCNFKTYACTGRYYCYGLCFSVATLLVRVLTSTVHDL